MSAGPVADSQTLRAQALATDPRASAWVTANAGSGKTFVLTQRVIRLLLSGAKPGRILCLTFTKAAAANMQDRIFKTLGRWVMLPDGELSAEVASMEGAVPRAEKLAAARRVFAAALETPGGLKIQTIHAFCERLLHTFPLEANVPADFQALDDAEGAELARAAIESVLNAAQRDPGGPLGRAAARLARETSIDSLSDRIRETIRLQRGLGEAWSVLSGALKPQLGLQPGDTVAETDRRTIEGGFAPADWPALADRAAKGSKKDQNLAERLRAAVAAVEPADKAREYRFVFLTKSMELRKEILTPKSSAADPGFNQALESEAARILGLLQIRRAAAAAERSQALLALAEAADIRIQAEKLRRGLLDFDDMIERARELFERADSAWVLFKLDGGLDHVLVDEAQDTSPAQWQIIRKLAGEFFAGHGRAAGGRTVFAVGDEKQSIFSFQGADPAGFSAAQRHFEAAAAGAGEAFHKTALRLSFRAAKPVLEAVDGVFRPPQNHDGLNAGGAEATIHTSARPGAPGYVEAWPLVPKPENEKGDVLNPPVNETPAETVLAQRIAARVKSWLDRRMVFADRTPLSAGDIMILVRSRGPLFEALLRELKRAGAPVAGADRLKLSSHIAVMDLIALGRAALNPEDDLALAEVLRSPLGGLTETELFEIAHGRAASLRAALAEAAGRSARYAEADRKLREWTSAAARETPYGFYAAALGPGGGWPALTGRLGPDSADAIEAFLSSAEACEGVHPPSLHGFIEAMKDSSRQIRRDMEAAGGAVRVMTVHGSKGLEARIVFLADTTTAPHGRHDANIQALRGPENANLAPAIVWLQGKENDPPEAAEARAEGREAMWKEYRRLLYVALTRACDQLVLCGIEQKIKAGQSTWRDMIEAGLSPAAGGSGFAPVDADGVPGPVLAMGTPALKLPEAPAAAAPAKAGTGLPDWCYQAASPESPALPPLNPSRALEAAARQPQDQPGAGALSARRRGILMHRLFERLPEAPQAERLPAALRLLARERLQPGEAEAMAGEAVRLLERPDIAPLFGPESRAEAALAGTVKTAGGLIRLSGRIDRLAVTARDVLVADLKTGRAPADAEISARDLGQLAAYRLLLRQIYPEKRIRCFILRTASGLLQEASAEAMDAAAHAFFTESVNRAAAAQA